MRPLFDELNLQKDPDIRFCFFQIGEEGRVGLSVAEFHNGNTRAAPVGIVIGTGLYQVD